MDMDIFNRKVSIKNPALTSSSKPDKIMAPHSFKLITLFSYFFSSSNFKGPTHSEVQL